MNDELSLENYYRKTIAVCEMLYGQPEVYYHKKIALGQIEDFNFEAYYVLITGFFSGIYYPYFGIEAFDYIPDYYITELEIHTILKEYGILSLTAVLLYDHSKRFCILFNAAKTIQAKNVAEDIAACVERMYDKIFDAQKTPYCNYTVISEEIHGYENLSKTFKEIDALSRQQYFDMRSMVMTPSLLERTRVPADHEQIHEDLMQMSVAMRAGEMEEMTAKYRAVMTQLEAARDFDLLSDALGSMRTTLEGVLRSHGVEPDAACRDVFAIEHYPTFQLQRDAIEAYLTESLARIGDTRPMSALIQEAVRYIRHHYAEDISVADIAEHIGMSPSWLTKRFRQECGENILSYLLSVRVERAKALLTETEMLVQEVACAVGFDTSRYFSSVFGRAAGMTPKAYREAHKK